MCGICGIYDLTGGGRANPALVRAMCDRIRHRGPDGDGFFDSPNAALGMRRLSIIDVAGSDQPLTNEDQTLALVFNGEIYNYRELRAGLLERGHTMRHRRRRRNHRPSVRGTWPRSVPHSARYGSDCPV